MGPTEHVQFLMKKHTGTMINHGILAYPIFGQKQFERSGNWNPNMFHVWIVGLWFEHVGTGISVAWPTTWRVKHPNEGHKWLQAHILDTWFTPKTAVASHDALDLAVKHVRFTGEIWHCYPFVEESLYHLYPHVTQKPRANVVSSSFWLYMEVSNP